jgi:aspartyl-tRNA(Asn)/glutamyl-tRNA(Gln) amidotransferase subunit A
MSDTDPRRLRGLTLVDAREALLDGRCTAVDLTTAVLDAAEAAAELGAYLTLDRERALAAAAASDARRRAGEPMRTLEGLPIALKDLLVTRGLRTTAGSRMLEDFVPPYDGTAVARLKAAGAVIVGKTNLDEFAMGSSNESSAFGPAKNPWDPERVPGGSSGGSAVAVAAELCFGALGTDTGGSIRQPAALCGVVGLKPTYGRVSRYGVVAFASSLDQVGPLGRSVADCAALLQAVAGHDPRDSTSATEPVADFEAAARVTGSLSGVRLGVPQEYFVAGMDPEVEASVRGAIARLAEAGAEVVDVTLPHTRYALSTYYLIATAEASSNLARYDGVRYGRRDPGARDLDEVYALTRARGFGAEVRRRILLGTFVLSAGYYDAYYLKAQRVRTLIRRDFERAFERVDAIVTPTSPTTAFRLGERLDDPLQMYLSDVYTLSCNLAGLPGLSVPCGLSSARLPIGLQLLGRPFDEATLLRVGAAFEALRGPFSRPPVAGEGGAS